jgi:hypothetical protein
MGYFRAGEDERRTGIAAGPGHLRIRDGDILTITESDFDGTRTQMKEQEHCLVARRANCAVET